MNLHARIVRMTRSSPLIIGGLLAGAGSLTASSAADRSQVEPQHTWDLSVMYRTQESWDQHYSDLEQRIRDLADLRGTTTRGPAELLKVLRERDQISVQLEKLYAFARLRHDEDMRQPALQALLQRAQALATQHGEALSWLNPELLQISEDQLKEWLTRTELKVYQHFFDDLLRSREHILSPREEELLAMSAKATAAAGDSFSLLTNTELRHRRVTDPAGIEIEVTNPVFYQAMESKDRRFRHDVFVALHESYLDVKATLATTLAGAMHRDWYLAKARGYTNSLEASLDAENLPVEVYHNLIDTIGRHTPLLHRYMALKQKVLGLDEIHFYDLYVNLAEAPEQEYSFEEARSLVLEGIQPFGAEYASIMGLAFSSRWIDVFENAGKRSGAYNMGTYLSPPYVLLNFKGTFGDVSTLAHEMGHAMQSYFTKENQPPVYADYPMFTAEVASTAAEILFKRSFLAKTTDPIERARLLNEMLEDIRQTVFRQTQFAEFDLAAHTLAEKGQPMTAEALMNISHDLYGKYFGPDFVIDSELDVECLRIPHYYRNFYVYRYATSYCAAAALAQHIAANEPGAVDRWTRFLKTGNSEYALDMLRHAGVDMATPQPIEDCMHLFEDLLTQLEELLTPSASPGASS
jgi:oligoendopeptidase F